MARRSARTSILRSQVPRRPSRDPNHLELRSHPARPSEKREQGRPLGMPAEVRRRRQRQRRRAGARTSPRARGSSRRRRRRLLCSLGRLGRRRGRGGQVDVGLASALGPRRRRRSGRGRRRRSRRRGGRLGLLVRCAGARRLGRRFGRLGRRLERFWRCCEQRERSVSRVERERERERARERRARTHLAEPSRCPWCAACP
mgnify:CR=1 FL=1